MTAIRKQFNYELEGLKCNVKTNNSFNISLSFVFIKQTSFSPLYSIEASMFTAEGCGSNLFDAPGKLSRCCTFTLQSFAVINRNLIN